MANVDKARDEIQAILNGDEYRDYHEQSSLLATWWDKVKSWLADLLEKLFPSLDKTSMLAGPILTIIIVVMLLLIAVALVFIIRNHRRKQKLRAQTPLHTLQEIDWSPQRHLSEASKYEDSESFALATRHLFLALLLHFHDNKWLEAKIWKTNWEYHGELKKTNQQAATQFYHLANFFDEATYGERQVELQEYTHFRTEVMKALGTLDE